MNYLVPILLVVLIIYASAKKVNVYNSFVGGARDSLPTILSIMPYLMAIFVMVSLMRNSGLSTLLANLLEVPFSWLGIEKQLIELVILRPLSGSGSLALLTEIYTTYGVDSYTARCASVMMGSTETVFYILAVYFAKTNIKKIGWALPIALLCNLVGCVVACLLCKII